MTFAELTRVMLSSMDFFELRRTAARYGVPYQGVRRSKLLRDLERKITAKGGGERPDLTGPASMLSAKAAAKLDDLDSDGEEFEEERGDKGKDNRPRGGSGRKTLASMKINT